MSCLSDWNCAGFCGTYARFCGFLEILVLGGLIFCFRVLYWCVLGLTCGLFGWFLLSDLFEAYISDYRFIIIWYVVIMTLLLEFRCCYYLVVMGKLGWIVCTIELQLCLFVLCVLFGGVSGIGVLCYLD